MNIYEFDSEIEAHRALQAEGRRLKYICEKVWRQYLASYQPVIYIRTRRATRGLKLGKVKKIGVDQLGIELTFIDDLMYHDSIIGKGQPQGHSLMLISSGWRVKRGSHKDIKNFGYKEGFDYIGKVLQAFEAGKHQGIDIEVQWSGKYLK